MSEEEVNEPTFLDILPRDILDRILWYKRHVILCATFGGIDIFCTEKLSYEIKSNTKKKCFYYLHPYYCKGCPIDPDQPPSHPLCNLLPR